MKNQVYVPKTARLTYRVLAYFLSFLTIVSPVMPSIAAVLPDNVIEQDFQNHPLFELIENSEDYEYKTPTFIEQSAPNALTIAGFHEQLKANNPDAMDEPIMVPIDVDDITVFIPVHQVGKTIGTAAVQSRYVRTQVSALLGRSLINATLDGYQTEAEQINSLYANAITYVNANPGVVFGQKLELDQAAADQGASNWPADTLGMIWPEKRMINGQEILVPIVFLTEQTVIDRSITSDVNELLGNVELDSLTLDNTQIKTGRDSFMQLASDLRNNNSIIRSEENLEIAAGGVFENISGTIESQGNLVIGAQSITNETVVYRHDYALGGHITRYDTIASINSENGSVTLNSASDINFYGAQASAGQAITLNAGGNIVLGAEELTREFGYRYVGAEPGHSAVSYLTSGLTAKDTIRLAAAGSIRIDAAEIVSDEGHIELLAGLGITVLDELSSTRSYQSGDWGDTSYEISAYKTVAMRALLDAGKGIQINTAFGDITLRAADISSNEGTSISANNGAINLLMTKETDHYSYSSITEGMFTIETTNRGHNIETGVQNTIVGGLTTEALYGLSVEYEGNPELSLAEQVAELGSMPGLEWMQTVREDFPDADWQAIDLAYEEWDETSKTLSPAVMAVISIAVAIATQGAATGLIESLGSIGVAANGATAAAISAGTSSLISQATVAVANGAVNGDIGGAIEGLASTDTLKNIATAMVTAGAIANLDSRFFDVDALAADNSALAQTVDGANSLSLAGQVTQAITHATVEAAVATVANGGDFSDFGDMIGQNLIQHGINELGEHMAGEIGGAFDVENPESWQTALKYISHAAAGCIIGAATASNNGTSSVESDCAAGAGGAVVGEFIGDQFRSSEEVEELQADLDAFVDGETEIIQGLIDRGETASGIRNIMNAERGRLINDLNTLRSKGANLAKLGAALTAFAAGADAEAINIAATAGHTAAYYNALSWRDATAALADMAKSIEEMLTSTIGPLEMLVEKSANWVIQLGVDASNTEQLNGLLNPLLDKVGLSRATLIAGGLDLSDPAILAGLTASLIDTIGVAAIIADTALKTSLPANIFTDFESSEAAFDRAGQAVDDTIDLVKNIDQVAGALIDTFKDAVVEGDPMAKAQVARLIGGLAIGTAMAEATAALTVGTGGLAAAIGVPITALRLQKVMMSLKELSDLGKVNLARVIDNIPVGVTFRSDGQVDITAKRSEFGACSFHGDTLVKTQEGFKPIRDIQANEDFVWSKDDLTGEFAWKQVIAQYSNPYEATVYVSIVDERSGDKQEIISNKIHPFFVQTSDEVLESSEGHVYQGEIKNGHWVDASELKAGYRLLNDNGSWSEVIGVVVEETALTAFNLTVADFHTYFVAANDDAVAVWVHNNCWDEADLPPRTPTDETTFDGRVIEEGPNGERIYKGHDGRYYDANVVEPTENLDHLTNGTSHLAHLEPEYVQQRMRDLELLGHGVQRHGPHVTEQQLLERAVRGNDPMTGTTTDGVHGNTHGYAAHATKVKTSEAYVYAEDFARNSPQFSDEIAAATVPRIEVRIPLKDLYGDDFRSFVTGVSRYGTKNNPEGYGHTIFSDDAYMAVRYKQDSSGNWVFNTMFPQPN